MKFFDESQARHSGDYKGVIFVFGSNLAGRHGKGAALYAQDAYGAEYGVGEGRTGQAYAIPTEYENLLTIQVKRIAIFVDTFLEYARQHPEESFFVTRIGCGLAGQQDKDIAPLFRGASDNCIFDIKWKDFLI